MTVAAAPDRAAQLGERRQLVLVQRHRERAGDRIARVAGVLRPQALDQLRVVAQGLRLEAVERVGVALREARRQDAGAGIARPPLVGPVQQQRPHAARTRCQAVAMPSTPPPITIAS